MTWLCKKWYISFVFLTNISFYIILTILYSLQGLPTCPINLTSIRSHLPEINCWGSLPHLFKEVTNNNESVTGNYNTGFSNKSVLSPSGPHPISGANPHKFHKYHKTHRKMPGFRGRRGWCGCLQVRFIVNSLMNEFASSNS